MKDPTSTPKIKIKQPKAFSSHAISSSLFQRADATPIPLSSLTSASTPTPMLKIKTISTKHSSERNDSDDDQEGPKEEHIVLRIMLPELAKSVQAVIEKKESIDKFKFKAIGRLDCFACDSMKRR
jgi:hypothetical protein